MSRLAIMLLTYATSQDSARARYAEKTLRAALDNLIFDGEIAVHIADDGSPQAHRDGLREIAGGYAHVQSVGVTNAERGGYGHSYNLATQAVHPGTDFVLPLEDDWELTCKLDVAPYTRALTAGLGCVRLGYLGSTQELRGRIEHIADATYLVFDPASPEPHVWAGHPRIESVAFQREVGPWPEHLDAGSTEFAVSMRPAARMHVGWPIAPSPWAHIGTVSARTDQGNDEHA